MSVIEEQQSVKRIKEEIEKKTGKTPEELYDEREKRVLDAIKLKEPDRIPFAFNGGYFPLYQAGLLPSAIFYDLPAYKQAVIKTLLEFEPDLYHLPNYHTDSGLALETIGTKQFRWPGGTLPVDYGQQGVDAEFMLGDEYDLLITDPTDFMIRYYLPRVFEALEPLSRIPTLGYRLPDLVAKIFDMTPLLATAEFQKLAQTLLKTGQEQSKNSQWDEALRDIGFPPFSYGGGIAGPPFDVIAVLRGTRGVMTDIFRRPEKLLTAMERVLDWRLARAAPADPDKKEYRRRVGGGATHYSSDRFMSKAQFEKFCWPTWKKALQATIDMGFIPWVHCEAKCDDLLEYFLDLPKGKFMIRFEEVDMARAKEVLGSHCCIGGNVPSSLLQVGSPQEVEEYCQNLIKVCGKGGGFILGNASYPDKAKPANIKVMIDSVKKYGRY